MVLLASFTKTVGFYKQEHKAQNSVYLELLELTHNLFHLYSRPFTKMNFTKRTISILLVLLPSAISIAAGYLEWAYVSSLNIGTLEYIIAGTMVVMVAILYKVGMLYLDDQKKIES